MDNNIFQKYRIGDSSRDYTYIDDVASNVVASIDNKKEAKSEFYNLKILIKFL